MASQVPPPADEVTSMFFKYTIAGVVAWIVVVSVLVLSQNP